MGLRSHQWGELVGIVFVLAATALQIFYLEPLRRQIEWRYNSFTQQQNAHIIAETVFDNRIATLNALKAAPAEIEAAIKERKTLMDRYTTAHANVANLVLAKEPVESILQKIVVALFIVGTLLTTFGRLAEMRAANQHR